MITDVKHLENPKTFRANAQKYRAKWTFVSSWRGIRTSPLQIEYKIRLHHNFHVTSVLEAPYTMPALVICFYDGWTVPQGLAVQALRPPKLQFFTNSCRLSLFSLVPTCCCLFSSYCFRLSSCCTPHRLSLSGCISKLFLLFPSFIFRFASFIAAYFVV